MTRNPQHSSTSRADTRPLTLGHSPDPDDAFMFWALATHRIDTEGLSFTHILQDIQTLNERARREELDVTAVSAHAFAFLADRYALLPCGASMGDGYGPIVVARQPLDPEALSRVKIAIPGTLTSAYLALRLCIGEFDYQVVPFEYILDEVADGRFEAGLLIHEGQLTYELAGVRNVLDLGVWWKKHTGGLPLPLGLNAVRHTLGRPTMSRIARVLRRSIQAGLAHREEALEHSLQWARGLEVRTADRFVGMYVNELTLDLGERGRGGMKRFLDEAFQQGLIPQPPKLEFVGYEE